MGRVSAMMAEKMEAMDSENAVPDDVGTRLSSYDSGFDEPPCLLRILIEDHKCISRDFCHGKELGCMNAHLRALVDAMPKSWSEGSAKNSAQIGGQSRIHLNNCARSRRWRRRNAICETSVEMRDRFTEALRAFLTLHAMLK